MVKKNRDYGAGEIILTSVNKEGLMSGFDIKLIKNLKEYKNTFIVHGGAGNFNHILDLAKKQKDTWNYASKYVALSLLEFCFI